MSFLNRLSIESSNLLDSDRLLAFEIGKHISNAELRTVYVATISERLYNLT
jgi:hypothetical protein